MDQIEMKLTAIPVAELKQVVETNKFPLEYTIKYDWNNHECYNALFAARKNPSKIAKILLKHMGVGDGTPVDSMRRERLALKKKELAIKEAKVNTYPEQTKRLFKILQRIEGKVNVLLGAAMTEDQDAE